LYKSHDLGVILFNLFSFFCVQIKFMIFIFNNSLLHSSGGFERSRLATFDNTGVVHRVFLLRRRTRCVDRWRRDLRAVGSRPRKCIGRHNKLDAGIFRHLLLHRSRRSLTDLHYFLDLWRLLLPGRRACDLLRPRDEGQDNRAGPQGAWCQRRSKLSRLNFLAQCLLLCIVLNKLILIECM
jgi:hypothetical protein